MDNKALTFFKANMDQYSTHSPSPVGRWLNGKLIKVEAGNLAWEYEVRAEMTNPGGVLHGGMAATMLDDVMGATVFSLGARYMFTSVNLNVDFLSSARMGDVVVCEAKVVRAGTNIIHIEGWLMKGDKLLVKASSNLAKTHVPSSSLEGA